MSKKNIGGTPGDESNPHGLTPRPEGVVRETFVPTGADPADGGTLIRAADHELMDGVRPQPATLNGDGPPTKAPAVKKSWSSPIQAMARIEQEMNGLDDRQRRTVFNWFADTYTHMPPEGMP